MGLKPLNKKEKKISDFINAASADGNKKSSPKDIKRTTVRMSVEQHKKIKTYCIGKEIDMNDIFLKAALAVVDGNIQIDI